MIDPELQNPNNFQEGVVTVTEEVQGTSHTPKEAERTQSSINELRAAVEARKAAKAAQKKED